MKKIFYSLALLLFLSISVVYSQNYNMQLRDHLTYTGRTSNIGGYALNGNEYALVGWEYGLSIVDVTNPDSVYEVLNVPGIQSNWREVKTFNNHAYVTTEGGGGLQIVDLSNLPASAPVVYYTGDGVIAGQLTTIHALHIDNGYVYLYGTNLFFGAALICDLNADPLNPVFMGYTPGSYVHDGYVRNDTLWACEIYSGTLAVYDVTDKTNPVLLNIQVTPGAFTHNSWLNDEGTVIFTTDEVGNSYLTAYDITDVNNITELDRYQTAPGSGSIVHNTHTLNNYEVVSWYTEGVVIVDASHPDNLVEVAKYDCSPFSGGGFSGAWGVYPYLPSGNLLVSDIEGGLFVLTPIYMRACLMQGLVTDSATGLPINNALVSIVTTNSSATTNLNGNYKTGYGIAGTYDVTITAFGYVSKTITGVTLVNDSLTVLDVQLAAAPTFTLTGTVTEAVTGNPVANAKVKFQAGSTAIDITADPSGNFSLNNFVSSTWDVTAQQWGYKTTCINSNLVPGSTLNLVLTPGIYDDFTFDWGWTVTGTAATGMFELAEPLGTSTSGIYLNPEFDVAGDCGDRCYVTGNTGTQLFDDAVFDGFTQIESPVFDLTGIGNPILRYQRWFFNYGDPGSGINANDTFRVSISNGAQTVVLENYHPGNTLANWTNKMYVLHNYITFTSTMKIFVYTSNEIGAQDLLEAGFDKFEIIAGPTSGITEAEQQTVQLFPNPAVNMIQVSSYKTPELLLIYDVTGREVKEIKNPAADQSIDVSDLEPGTYMVTVTFKDGSKGTQKLLKN